MPTYQMAPSYDSTDTLKEWRSYIICISRIMCGMYLSCCWAFIYYCVHSISRSGWLHWGCVVGVFFLFFIIIAAGHIWKFVTLAYIPPTIAGMVLAYRGKYLSGGLLTAVLLLCK